MRTTLENGRVIELPDVSVHASAAARIIELGKERDLALAKFEATLAALDEDLHRALRIKAEADHILATATPNAASSDSWLRVAEDAEENMPEIQRALLVVKAAREALLTAIGRAP